MNLAHSASFHSREKTAPSKPGIKHLTDVVGHPYSLMLTPGNVADVTAAPMLLRKAGRMRHLVAEKGYDAGNLREDLRQGGTVPVIPGHRNR